MNAPKPDLLDRMADALRKTFIDRHGVNYPAVAFVPSAVVYLIFGAKTGKAFDFAQFGCGMAALMMGYTAAAASRAGTIARFRKLEQRLEALESQRADCR
jgi:hypothetical protein